MTLALTVFLALGLFIRDRSRFRRSMLWHLAAGLSRGFLWLAALVCFAVELVPMLIAGLEGIADAAPGGFRAGMCRPIDSRVPKRRHRRMRPVEIRKVANE